MLRIFLKSVLYSVFEINSWLSQAELQKYTHCESIISPREEMQKKKIFCLPVKWYKQ